MAMRKKLLNMESDDCGETQSFHQMCKLLGKGPGYIRRLQLHLKLYMPSKQEGYSVAYMSFMEKAVSLRAFSVPLDDIADLLQKEKKILELLHVDSMTNSPAWYLELNTSDGTRSDRHLLLTGYDLGFPVASDHIQSNLDFGIKDQELFTRQEMGEDIRHVMDLYLKQLEKVKKRVFLEKPLLERALFWSEEAFWV